MHNNFSVTNSRATEEITILLIPFVPRDRKKIINGMTSVRNFRPIKEHFTKALLPTSGLNSI